MLEIKNLKKNYGKTEALKNFNYTFENGIYGLLGANGAGKSTLMNLITDNIKRTGGSILYGKEDIMTMGGSFRKLVGYMPQQQGFYEHFSARTFLYYIAELKGIRKKDAKLQIENLLQVVNLSKAADKKIGGFSGGMKQEGIACTRRCLEIPKYFFLTNQLPVLTQRNALISESMWKVFR